MGLQLYLFVVFGMTVFLGNAKGQIGNLFPSHGADFTIRQLQAEVENLKSTVQDLITGLRTLKQGNAGQGTPPPSPEKRVTNQYRKMDTRYSADNGVILNSQGYETGFHVSLTGNHPLASGNVIIFDDVITNIGGAFDKTSGKFTCPVAGTYLFSISVVCDKYTLLHTSVFKNGHPYFNSLCDNRSGETWNQGGGTTILKLNKGDTVWMGMIWPDEGTAYGHGMTSFSGYLLHLN